MPEPPADAGSDRAPQPAQRPGASGFTEIPIQSAVSPAASSTVPPTSPAVPPRPDLTLPPAPGAIESIEATEATEPEEPANSAADHPVEAEYADVPSVDVPTAPSETPIQREVADAKAPVTPADVATDPVATTPPSPLVHPVAPVAISPAPAGLTSVPLPLGAGLRTSIQRSSALPGPGTPAPTLVVRPAPLIPDPPSRERVVPIQRMPVAEPPSPPAQRTGSSVAGARIVGAGGPTDPAGPGAGPAPTEAGAPGVSPGVSPLLQRASAAAGIQLGPTALDGGRAPASVLPPGAPATASPRAVSGVLPLARSATDAVPSRAAAVDVEPATEPGVVDVSGGSTPWTDASSALDAGQVVVARAEDPAAVADSAPAAAVGGSSGGGPPKAASGSEDVDALAQRLFPPMLRRIKNEFLLDRERRGIRTDAW